MSDGSGTEAEAPAPAGRLEGRLVALGVTGSIAAYKAVELLRLLRAEGADVSVMLTQSAAQFVGAAVVRRAVPPPGRDRRARPAARRPDRPHRRRRHGGRDRRRARPPRTGSGRWRAAWPATSSPRRVSRRRRRSWSHRPWTATCGAIRPRSPTSRGCGPSATRSSSPDPVRSPPVRTGSAGWPSSARSSTRSWPPSRRRPVRAPDPAARPPLVGPARDADLAGRHVVVTAGGTREAIDPVRFIGNRSTGRMGAAIAEAALDRGARVTVVAANVEVDLPPAATVVRVGSTAELRAALLRLTQGPAADRRLRRPGHGRGRRRLPAGRHRRDQAPAHRRPDPPSWSRPRTSSPRSPGSPTASTATAPPRASRCSRSRSWSGSPRRRARSSGPPTSSGARAWTCSSRTTWPSPARASGPTPTACRSWPPTDRGRTCRC